MTIKIQIGIRLPKEDKIYWQNQMRRFASLFDPKQISCIQFGKQDIRGTESITLVDHRHCVPKQVHFANKWMMLGYIQGYNESNGKLNYNPFGAFVDKEAA